MAERRISVENVKSNPKNNSVTVVLWEKQLVEGKQEDVPLGSQLLVFHKDTTPQDMLPRIKQAAKDIGDLADKAKITRAKLNELLESEAI